MPKSDTNVTVSTKNGRADSAVRGRPQRAHTFQKSQVRQAKRFWFITTPGDMKRNLQRQLIKLLKEVHLPMFHEYYAECDSKVMQDGLSYPQYLFEIVAGGI